METDEYRTLEGTSEGVYKEKGSKFIAIASPVGSVDEVKLQLDKLRKQYHDARHHCYAYRIGYEPIEFRQNDDGEPSGTAGKPILGQIQSFELTNTLVVVIRYFGGVKLGTGGLIQAYRTAARTSLENGKIITKRWTIFAEIKFDYQQMDTVMRIIKDEGLRIVRQELAEKCVMLLEIRRSNFDRMGKKFTALDKLELTVI